jgi:hypothetical protein
MRPCSRLNGINGKGKRENNKQQQKNFHCALQDDFNGMAGVYIGR